MSRKVREDVGERLRRGKSQDGGHVSVTHARNSANFLSPDASHGLTSLERAPSLNRLHAQSSTETSGLGETVTSGFSSQESVHSFAGDEKEREGSGKPWERSTKRGGGGSSPGSLVRPTADYEYVDKDGHPSGGARQQPHLHQTSHHLPGPKYVTFSKSSQRPEPIGHVIRDHERSKRLHSYGQSTNDQGNSSRHYRETGGRSLTPQQAKDEQDSRRKQIHRTGSDQRKSGSGSSVVDTQPNRRPDLSDRKKSGEIIELQDRSFSSRERSSSAGSSYPECDVRRRLHSSGGSRESSITEADREYQRQSSSGAKAERAFVVVGRTRSNSKDGTTGPSPPSVSTRSHSKDHTSGATAVRSNSRLASKDNTASAPAVRRGSRSNNRDAVDTLTTTRASSKTNQKEGGLINVRTSAERTSSRESVQHNLNVSGVEGVSREKLAAELNAREREKRSRSREQSRSQSSSSRTNSDEHHESSGSRKSCDTVRLKSQSQDSKLNSEDESVFVDARKPSKEQVTKPVLEPTSQVSVEITSRRNRSSAISESGQDTFTNSKGVGDIKPGEDRSQTRTKVTEEQRIHSSKLRRVDSRVPYERQRNEQTTEKRELKEVKSEQKECKSDATVRFTDKSKPADETRRYSHRDSTEKREGSVVPQKDVQLKSTRSNSQGQNRAKNDKVRSEPKISDSTSSSLRSARRVSESDFIERPDRFRRTPDEIVLSKTEQLKFSDNESRVKRTEHGARRVSDNEEQFSVYDAEIVKSDVDEEEKSSMDYDLFFHQASRGVNGTGGGGGGSGYRGYPLVLDGGYSSPSLRREARGQFVLPQNYINGNNVHTSGLRPGAEGARGVPNVIGPDFPAPNTRSAHYTKFQVPTTPMGPIPTVQLIASPELPGYNIDALHNEWERRGSKSSIRSYTSNKSSGPKFLGVTTESAWTKWSRDRRASYRRRLEKMERSETIDNDVVRVSTPIKKARQEGLKFVHPDLEARYLSEDDLNELRRHKQQQVHVMRVIEKSRKNKFRMKTEVKLTAEQWHALQEFWEHTMFVRARYLGLVVSMLALIFLIVSIAKNDWMTHGKFSTSSNVPKSSIPQNASIYFG
ncbi:filaggrin-2 [Biomphalaria glabrata]|nr:filaggrin-2; partial [Biomphalaria glabrata]